MGDEDDTKRWWHSLDISALNKEIPEEEILKVEKVGKRPEYALKRYFQVENFDKPPERLGAGSFGYVDEYFVGGKSYAVKNIKSAYKKDARDEFQVAWAAGERGIGPKVYGGYYWRPISVEFPKKPNGVHQMIIFDVVRHGTLEEYYKKVLSGDTSVAVGRVRNVLRAMEVLAERMLREKIFPSNRLFDQHVLVDDPEGKVVKVIDYGPAFVVDSVKDFMVGQGWFGPEKDEEKRLGVSREGYLELLFVAHCVVQAAVRAVLANVDKVGGVYDAVAAAILSNPLFRLEREKFGGEDMEGRLGKWVLPLDKEQKAEILGRLKQKVGGEAEVSGVSGVSESKRVKGGVIDLSESPPPSHEAPLRCRRCGLIRQL